MILKKYLRLQSLRSPFCEGRNWNDPQPMAMAYKHPYVYSCFFFFFSVLTYRLRTDMRTMFIFFRDLDTNNSSHDQMLFVIFGAN